VNFLEQTKKFTLNELEKFNGENGNPAYIAYNGNVYDVTESIFWMDGIHSGSHQAGKDLTQEMDLAPHGPESIEKMKLVGTIQP
jgi:predicted heme/steroid binding protein